MFFIVKLRLGFWLKGWCPKFPYALGNVICNLNPMRLWGSRIRKEVNWVLGANYRVLNPYPECAWDMCQRSRYHGFSGVGICSV